MTLSDLEKRLFGASLEDVLLVGFIDSTEQPPRFRTLLEVVYFDIGGGLLKFRTVGGTGTMAVTLATTLENDFELDDDMVFSATSVRPQVLRETEGENGLTALRLWHVEMEAGELRCWSAQIDLANGQQIFIDPYYYFGIRLGGAEQREFWRQKLPSAALERELVLTLSKS
jgi:hypothetical protein